MEKRFDNILLLSDLDGTLFNSKSEVPLENQKAIQRFVEKGGMFGISTGRTPSNALPMLESVTINAPSIFLNGSLLYDPVLHAGIQSHNMHKEDARKIAEFCLENYPSIDVQIYDGESILFVSPEETANQEWVQTHRPCVFTDIGSILDRSWMKFLLMGDHDTLEHLLEQLRNRKMLTTLDAVFSSNVFLEVLPKGVSKGRMLEDLRAMVPNRKIYAIGDFYNDVELLSYADISATPENGVQELKSIARYIVCRNDVGAVADFIERIEHDAVY